MCFLISRYICFLKLLLTNALVWCDTAIVGLVVAATDVEISLLFNVHWHNPKIKQHNSCESNNKNIINYQCFQ